jgi:hypothetical protein
MRHIPLLFISLLMIPTGLLSSERKLATPVRDTTTTQFSAAECHDEWYGKPPAFYDQMTWVELRDDLKLTTSNASSCAQGDNADKQQAYIIQVVHWQHKSSDNGSDSAIGIVSSDWYVYKTVIGKPSKLTLSGYTAAGDPLIYGKKRALIVAINVFDNHPPKGITIDYKASVKQGTPENVQDLGKLVTSLLGLTVPTAKAVACKHILVAYTCKQGTDRLPYDLNIVMTAGIKQPKTDSSSATNATKTGDASPGYSNVSKLDQPHHQSISPPLHEASHETSLVTVGFKAEDVLMDGDSPTAPQQDGNESPTKPSNKANAANDATSSDKSSQPNVQPGTVDCYDLASQQKCTSSRVFTSLDREWWDVSVGVTIPGVKQSSYSFSKLLRCELQPDTSTFLPDRVLDLLAPGNVQGETTALHEFE